MTHGSCSETSSSWRRRWIITAHPITWRPQEHLKPVPRILMKDILSGKEKIWWSKNLCFKWNCPRLQRIMKSSRVISTQNSKFISKLKNTNFINSIHAGQIQKINSKFFEASAVKINAYYEFYPVRNSLWVQKNHCQLICLNRYTHHTNFVAWSEKIIFLSSWWFSKHFSLIY